MSLATLSRGGFTSGNKTPRLTSPSLSGWVRPTDWLALPSVVGTQKFVGLLAVYPGDSNWVAVSFAGAHTIDWGDGSATVNVATGVTTSHNYTYASVSGTDSSRGYRQAIVTVTPQAGNNLTTVNLQPTRPTGMVSGFSSPWLDVKMAGTLIAIVSISSGTTRAAMLERFEFVGNSNITTSVPLFSNARSLQEIVGTTWTSAITSFASMFDTCTSLRTIPLFDTAAGLNFSNMFASCTALRTIPLLNTALGTNFSSMFNGCSALQEIPLLNTVAGTNFAAMFASCTALRTIPLLNTALGTSFASMLTSCVALQTIPLINTGLGISFSNMMSSCPALQSVPALNVVSGTDFNSMLIGCPSLQSAPLVGTSRSISYASAKMKGAALDAIYTGLASLNLLSANAASVETSVADWNTNIVNCGTPTQLTTGMTLQDGSAVLSTLATAAGEVTVALTTRVAVSGSTQYTALAQPSSVGVVARTCRIKIGWYDAGGALISTSTGADDTTGVSSVMGKQISVTATSPSNATTATVILSWTAVVANNNVLWDRMGLFPGTVTTWNNSGGTQTITVTSNWDVANDTPSIATAKGWTVTGS